jgi:PH domain/Calponin homology (CH) domain
MGEGLSEIERLRGRRLFRAIGNDRSVIRVEDFESWSRSESVQCDEPTRALLLSYGSELQESNVERIKLLDFIKWLGTLDEESKERVLTLKMQNQRTLVAGSSSSGGHHSYAQTEQASFAEYISSLLSSEQDLVDRYFPLTADTLFSAVSDGVLLCRLVNTIAPGTIPRQKFTDRDELNALQVTENLSVSIQYAREKLGCRLLNIGANDLADGKGHLILAFLWQLIKIDLANSVAGVGGRGAEAIAALTSSSVAAAANAADAADAERNPESMLFDWVNEQLEAAGHAGRIRNFSGDIRSCEKYVVLLNRLAPSACPLSIADEPEPMQRAEFFLQAADKVDCRKFVSAQDICRGNSRMNFAFVASLFSHFHGVSPVAQANNGGASQPTLPPSPADAAAADEAAAKLAQAEAERENLRAQLDRAMQLVKQQSDRLDMAPDELESAKQARHGAEAERDALRESSERELAAGRAKLAELADAADSSDANKQLQDMCERLEQKLSTAEERAKALQGDADEMRARAEAEHERAAEAEARVEAAEEVLLELKEQLDEAKSATTGDNGDEATKGGSDDESGGKEIEELRRKLRNLERVAEKADKNKEKLSFLKEEVADLSEENNVLIERLQYLQGRFDDDEALARAIFQECAADALQHPTRAGMLTKQGGSVKTWKRRYFVLKENFLFYYKSQKDSSKPLGVIHLDEYEVVLAKSEEIKNQKGADKETRGRNFFKIITPTRTYFICAERQVDMDLWLDAIKSAPRWYRSTSAAYRRTIARAASSVAEGYDDY